MAANSIVVDTIVFGLPSYPNEPINYQPLSTNESFTHVDDDDITTLSTNNADLQEGNNGLLYVPDIEENSACYNASAPYIPANVTRQIDLPTGHYEHVAIAPWLDPDCVQLYLASAREQFVGAFIFFVPNTTIHPQNESAGIWNLGDGGAWKSQNNFPVYAIPGASAHTLLQASSQYSGNLTDVPNGDELAKSYDPSSYVRLLVTINGSTAASLPSLWVFLLVVLAIVLAIIALTSVAMHLLQRRRRQSLRRRVANGEVDLEALGIKRLTVPTQILNKMPVYTYGTQVSVITNKAVASNRGSVKITTDSRTPSAGSISDPIPVLKRSTSYRPSPLQQPTCAICLEDFVPASSESPGSRVRELPCHHIFHPECIDSFLRSNSSLCPMCKKSVLPQGYCPRIITNGMVRRERVLRGLRPPTDEEEQNAPARDLPLHSRIRRHTASGLAQLSRFSGFSTRDDPEATENEMTRLPPARAGTQQAQSPVLAETQRMPSARSAEPQQPRTPAAAESDRREWARQRAVAMLGSAQDIPLDPDAEENSRTSGWRRALRTVFPRTS